MPLASPGEGAMNESQSDAYIVIAEDNPADVYLVKEALRGHGVECNVSVLSDGEQTLKFIENLDTDSNAPCPDLWLVDLHLPKHDGAEILTRLRASERCWKTQVIVMSSSDSTEDKAQAEGHGALHYFRKPGDLDEFMKLGSLVKEYVRQRAMRWLDAHA